MKRLVCEMCGSTDLIKKDGVFVCQTCGCKYSIEEARKMMVEGTVEVAGTVKVDNTGLIDSYLQMAENALDAGNNSEAESYANKIIEIDPAAWRAWFIKGKASGWQTTGRNNRYPESIVNWINSYQYAPEAEKAELAEKIKKEAVSISAALLQMECNSFVSYRSDNSVNDIKKASSLIEQQLGDLKTKTGIDVYTDAFKTILARAINTCAVNGSNGADKEFGTERSQQGKHQWNRYTAEQDRCLSLLDKAYDLSSDDSLSFTICKNYISIAEAVKNSKSYKFQADAYGGSYNPDYAFTESAKEARTKTIDSWKDKRDFHDPDKRKSNFQIVKQNCEDSIKEIEESFALQQYWEQHAGEKASLGGERAYLFNQIEEVKKSKLNNPMLTTRSALEEDIASKKKELASLGFFKGKEKRALQEKINNSQAELNSINETIKAYENNCDEQIKPLQKRIDDIDTELTKSRGRIPVVHNAKPDIFVEGSKDLRISPIELLHFLVEKLPKPYNLKTGTEDDIVNYTKVMYDLGQSLIKMSAFFGSAAQKSLTPGEWKDNPTKNKTYRFNIFEGDESTNTAIHCDAKSTKSAIEESIRFVLGSGFDTDDATDFVRIVSMVIYDLLPSAKLSDLQSVLAGCVYGITDTKSVTSDGLKIEFKRSNSVILKLTLE